MRHRSALTTLAAIAASVAALAAPAGASAQECAGADSVPTAQSIATARSATLCLLNRQRTSRGLRALRPNGELRSAAAAYADSMVSERFFDHVSPSGSTLVERIRRTDYLNGPGAWTLGENLAWGSGELASPRKTVSAWMRSPGHRRNILDRGFREIGIGIAPGAPVNVDGALPAATYATEFGSRG